MTAPFPWPWVGLEWVSYVSVQAAPLLCGISLGSLAGTIGGAWIQVVLLFPAYAMKLCSLWDFEDPCISQSVFLLLE